MRSRGNGGGALRIIYEYLEFLNKYTVSGKAEESRSFIKLVFLWWMCEKECIYIRVLICSVNDGVLIYVCLSLIFQLYRIVYYAWMELMIDVNILKIMICWS